MDTQDTQLFQREAVDLRGPVLLFQVMKNRKDFPRIEVDFVGRQPLDGRSHGRFGYARHCKDGMTNPPLPLRLQVVPGRDLLPTGAQGIHSMQQATHIGPRTPRIKNGVVLVEQVMLRLGVGVPDPHHLVRDDTVESSAESGPRP